MHSQCAIRNYEFSSLNFFSPNESVHTHTHTHTHTDENSHILNICPKLFVGIVEVCLSVYITVFFEFESCVNFDNYGI